MRMILKEGRQRKNLTLTCSAGSVRMPSSKGFFPQSFMTLGFDDDNDIGWCNGCRNLHRISPIGAACFRVASLPRPNVTSQEGRRTL